MRTIDDFSLATYFLKRYYTQDIEISKHSDDLDKILKQNPKLVCAIHHGSAPAPFPILSAMYDNFLKHGGGNRKPLLIVWRAFYKIPIFKHFIRYMTQVDNGLSAADFLHKFKNEGFTDLLVLPEGENCMFGEVGEIVPFLSPKFIEFSIRGNAPVLIVAHTGTEKMSTAYEFKEEYLKLVSWLPKRHLKLLSKKHYLNYPHFWESDLDKLRLYYKLYTPTLTEADLSDDDSERLKQLEHESNQVQKLMTEMKNTLNEGIDKGKAKKARRKGSLAG